MEQQKVNIYAPFVSDRVGHPPLVIRVGVQSSADNYVGGVPMGMKAEAYILLSALPEELRARVELAVQALIAGG